MSQSEEPLMSYEDLLKELEESGSTNHLLLGNGFNNTLCISTAYKDIYDRMAEEYKPYEKIRGIISKQSYDIEWLINRYKAQINGEDQEFLKQFIENKIKSDFMKALSSIVTSEVRNIYQERADGIYLFFQNFDNYFTLNYDPFLYLLLLRFVKSEDNQGIVIREEMQYFPPEQIQRLEEIGGIIETAYDNGDLQTHIKGELASDRPLNKIPKVLFTNVVKDTYREKIRSKEWLAKEVDMAIKRVYDKKDREDRVLEIRDGFVKQGKRLVYQKSLLQGTFLPRIEKQNLFFLHGGFHLIDNNGVVEKITQTQAAAFHKRLEEIIQAEEKDVLCILTGTSKEKAAQIEEAESEYLSYALEQLGKVSGNVVILGCSYSSNDSHIFDQLKRDDIETIYVATCEDEREAAKEAAEQVLPKAKIKYFDYETINGYKLD